MRWYVFAAAAVPELGWSVGEALFMPYLIQKGVSATWLGVGWLFAPILGFCLHPLIGGLSDRYGRRPFVLALGIFSVVGLMMIPLSSVYVAIVGYGLVDLSHDLMMTVSRAFVNDHIKPAQSANSYYAIFSGVGKIVAFCIAGMPWDTVFRLGLSQVTYAFYVSSFCIAWLTAVAVAGTRNTSEPLLLDDESTASEKTPTWSSLPSGFVAVMTLATSCWMANNAYAFYGSSFIAVDVLQSIPGTPEFGESVRFACVLFMALSGANVVVGLLLPEVSQPKSYLFLIGCSLLYPISTFLLLLGNRGWMLLAFALQSIPYQAVCILPFTWLEDTTDSAHRGFLTGMLNLAIPGSQILVIILGSLLNKEDHLLPLFHCVMAVTIVCGAIVLFWVWMQPSFKSIKMGMRCAMCSFFVASTSAYVCMLNTNSYNTISL